jgi:hypothetical protein
VNQTKALITVGTSATKMPTITNVLVSRCIGPDLAPSLVYAHLILTVTSEKGTNMQIFRIGVSQVPHKVRLAGPDYFTRALELVAKFSTKEGKIPNISVPSAAAHNVVRMPGLSGSSVTVDSPGSCMYITTMMRR